MTRSQRRWHLYLWLTLAPLILLGFLSALLMRPVVPIQSDKQWPADRTSGAAPGADGETVKGQP